MADDGTVTSSLNLDGAYGADNQPTAAVISQYVKDLSVENPHAPASFQWQDAPQMDVQFNIQARPIQADVHEVELKVTLTAKHEAGTAYIVDLTYAGLVGMRNLDEPQMHAFIFAEGPRFLFPFARRVLADAVRDAGFQPMMLEPIDFAALYVEQLQAAAAQAEAEGAANGAGGADLNSAEPAGNA